MSRPRRPRAQDLALEIVVDRRSGWRRVRGIEALCRRAAAAAAAVTPRHRATATVALALIADGRMRQLNRAFRGKDAPTNVLAFPAGGDSGEKDGLGDIAIAFGVARREAASEGKTLPDHAAHLVVHGVLHLFGYDHNTARAAAAMERLERTALGRLGIADPYREGDLPL